MVNIERPQLPLCDEPLAWPNFKTSSYSSHNDMTSIRTINIQHLELETHMVSIMVVSEAHNDMTSIWMINIKDLELETHMVNIMVVRPIMT
jgi:hypothetical protein